jgi:carbamoyl-phosphate synthase small subunit
VREFSQVTSNWRSAESAQLYLNRHKIPVIWDIDTRALVRHIRKLGALRGIVATDGTPADQLVSDGRARIGWPGELQQVLRLAKRLYRSRHLSVG